MPRPARLDLHARHAPRPTDATPAPLRRALRTRAYRIVSLDGRFDQVLLLARTPGGPSAWVLTHLHGTRRRKWTPNLLVGRRAPPPPFPTNPKRPAPALRDALAILLPLLPDRARRQEALADLLRRAHGAAALAWDVDLHIRRGRGFARGFTPPLAGQLRLTFSDGPPGPWIDGAALEAAVPKGLVPLLFPVLASARDTSNPFIAASGERPSGHDRLAARTFLEEHFGPFG